MFIKYYIYAAVLAAVLGGVWWINSVFEENKKLNKDVEVRDGIIALRDSSIKIRDEKIAKIDKQVNDTAEFLQQQKVIEDENKRLRACVAAGTCGVRFKKASCPARLPETGADISGSPAGDIRFDAGVEQLILGFREKIKHNQSVCERRIKQLRDDRK